MRYEILSRNVWNIFSFELLFIKKFFFWFHDDDDDEFVRPKIWIFGIIVLIISNLDNRSQLLTLLLTHSRWLFDLEASSDLFFWYYYLRSCTYLEINFTLRSTFRTFQQFHCVLHCQIACISLRAIHGIPNSWFNHVWSVSITREIYFM